jgi:hypothetical protein
VTENFPFPDYFPENCGFEDGKPQPFFPKGFRLSRLMTHIVTMSHLVTNPVKKKFELRHFALYLKA